MRIHHDDCDIPLPEPEDLLSNLRFIPGQTRAKFIPAESEILSKMWISLVKISASLGKILRIHYPVKGSKPSVEDITASHEDLLSCKPQEALTDSANDLLLLHGYHVELFYE